MNFGNFNYKDIVVKDKDSNYKPKLDFDQPLHVSEYTKLLFKPSNTTCTIGELLSTIRNMDDNFKPLVESNNNVIETLNNILTIISPDGAIGNEIALSNLYKHKTDHAILTLGQELSVYETRLDSLTIRNRVLFLSNSLLSFFVILFLILLVSRF